MADEPGELVADPFVALMWRYVVEYTNTHDASVCDEIMDPGYCLHMGGHDVRGRDGAYKPAVAAQYRQFPYLGIVAHDVVSNGDRLALHFSEHGASNRFDGNTASWSGIGVYDWDGARLLENWVEQDYFARRLQLTSGVPTPLDPPALDPWVVPAVPADAGTEVAARRWLEEGSLDGEGIVVDDRGQAPGSKQPGIDVTDVTVDDLFSAGTKFGFHATWRGAYLGGLDGHDDDVGTEVLHYFSGIGTVTGGIVTARVITDRLGLDKRLSAGAG